MVLWKSLLIKLNCFILCFIFSTQSFAVSLLDIVAVVKAPKRLPKNESARAVYQITNRTPSLTSFAMQPIQGVSVITTMTGACGEPITLSPGESCLLYLRIRGNQIASKTQGGPIVCYNQPHPFGCSRPSNPANSLDITSTKEKNYDGSNTWIAVLIADDEAPSDQVSYVNKIYQLAPAAEQIHIRVDAGANGCSSSHPTACQPYLNLIALLRQKYTAPLLIGFHPDDSKSSYQDWGCMQGDWQCVLNASITVMNDLNALADPKHQGEGFNIFSLEQSYAVPEDAETLRDVKACLNPSQKAPSASCPDGVATASPVVKFGWVLPSYGGCVQTIPPTPCDNQYGPDALDYGYPQYYNLGVNIGSYTNLISNGFFPSYSTACISGPPYPSPLYTVDEDNGDHPYNPEIPCPTTGQVRSNIFTYPAQGATQPPNITLSSAYISYILTQLPPISDIPNTNGSQVYLTFSGEGPAQAPSLFLGTPGWTLDNILLYYQAFNTDFVHLFQQYPPPDPMFKGGVFSQGIKPTAIKYAIWNFSSILNNIPDA